MVSRSAGHAPSPVDQEVEVSLVRSWATIMPITGDRVCDPAARLSGRQQYSLDLWLWI